jgi:hypothetical protein
MRGLRMTFRPVTMRQRAWCARPRVLCHRRSSTRSEPEKHKPAAWSREAWAARNTGCVHKNIGSMATGAPQQGGAPRTRSARTTSSPSVGEQCFGRTCRMSERGTTGTLTVSASLLGLPGEDGKGRRPRAASDVSRPIHVEPVGSLAAVRQVRPPLVLEAGSVPRQHARIGAILRRSLACAARAWP